MEEKGKAMERTWDDVQREMEAAPKPPEGEPPRHEHDPPPPGPEPGPGKGPHHGPHHRRVGAGRLTAYLLLTVLLNVLLAIYTLYILGLSMEGVQAILNIGRVDSIPRLVFGVLIMVSPLLLTILFNRLLYCAMRGRGRFPRGIWLFAAVLVVIVQVLSVYVIYTAGAAPALETFTVETFSGIVN